MSGAPILERMKTALETGVWWSIPWWRNNKYYKNGIINRKKAETAFCELIRTFNAKWLLEQKTNGTPPFTHEIANHLTTEGLLQFHFFSELGGNLRTARVNGLIGDIERRLKSSKEYWEAAAFELKLLSSLILNRYEVKRHYQSGNGKHNCDFQVSRGSEIIFIEIKRPVEISARNQQIVQQAQSQFCTNLLNDAIKNEEDFTSSSLSSKSEIDKVFKLIRYAVNNQLPQRGPGVVIVESPHALNWDQFASSAEKRFHGRKNYSSLSSIILIQIEFQGGKLSYKSKLLCNHRAKISLKNAPFMKIFNNLNKTGGLA